MKIDNRPATGVYEGMTRTIRNILDGAKNIIQLFPPPGLPEITPFGRYARDPHRTDAEAIASDWQAVGDSLRKAMGSVGDEAKQTRR